MVYNEKMDLKLISCPEWGSSLDNMNQSLRLRILNIVVRNLRRTTRK